jgi:hypothetical protein
MLSMRRTICTPEAVLTTQPIILSTPPGLVTIGFEYVPPLPAGSAFVSMITDEQLLTMPFAQQLVIVKLPAPTPGSAVKNPYIDKLKSTGHLAPIARQPARLPLMSLRSVTGKALGQGIVASWHPVTLPATL